MICSGMLTAYHEWAWENPRGSHLQDDPIDYCEAALNDEQPLPATQARHAIHVEQASSQGRANESVIVSNSP